MLVHISSELRRARQASMKLLKGKQKNEDNFSPLLLVTKKIKVVFVAFCCSKLLPLLFFFLFESVVRRLPHGLKIL